MGDLPGSVLFACNRNIIRSPMAEGLMKHLLGHRIYVDSVGVRLSAQETDAFAIAALAEIGLDISDHQPKTFEEAADHSIDLIVTFTPQAQHWAMEFTRTLACEVEYWPMPDPTVIPGWMPKRDSAAESRLPPRNTTPKHQPTPPTSSSSGEVATHWKIMGSR